VVFDCAIAAQTCVYLNSTSPSAGIYAATDKPARARCFFCGAEDSILFPLLIEIPAVRGRHRKDKTANFR
jgi:hypothetical protein